MKRTTKQPLIAVSADVRQIDGASWHAVHQRYLEAAVTAAGVFPVIVPSLGDRLDLNGLLAAVDGVMLTGAVSSVHPALYAGDASEANGPYDVARDSTTLPLIRMAIDRGVPVLAICRGMQEMNVALGGSLAPEIHERTGSLDHRAPESESSDEWFSIRHTVTIEARGYFASLIGAEKLKINSLHRQAVERLGDRLQVEAVAEDGTIEAVSVRDGNFAVGVQWHPEYWVKSDDASARIFRAFGDEVRSRARARSRSRKSLQL